MCARESGAKLRLADQMNGKEKVLRKRSAETAKLSKRLRELNDLQCPFTWDIPTFIGDPDFEGFLKVEEDRLLRSAHLWSSTVTRLSLAYHYSKKGNFDKCRSFLVECYMTQLDDNLPGSLQGDCEIVKKYKVALRHVLDSTWVFACDMRDSPYVEDFVKRIIRYSSMDNAQKSAVLAIRARMSQDSGNSEYAMKAIELNPQEGQWHFYVANFMYLSVQDGHHTGSFDELLKHSHAAYNTRKTPETLFLHAEILFQSNQPKAAENILNEALQTFPDSIYLNLECGRVYGQPTYAVLSISKAKKCLLKALALAKDCLEVHLSLGNLYACCQQWYLAKEHLTKALPVYKEAAEPLDCMQVFEGVGLQEEKSLPNLGPPPDGCNPQ